ncbi:lysoplasmalogenase family protein [Flavobacterium sp.]|uniref:lysoplasmalogenase family protein n=1 Tax=Flavobacterium sp. TaxID=239 RepID=UPI003449D266
MKPNKPSLLLYFTACILVVIFKLLEYDSYVLYTKSVIVPLIFIYYFITNNYRITWIKAVIFLFCFIGDVFNLLNFDISPLGALLSFLFVYLLLLKLAYDDFRCLKFNERDRFPILISFFFIVTISTSILNLKFEKMVYDFSLYVIYGIILSILIFVSVTNYIKKPNNTFMNLVIMCGCAMVSDAFFIINKFYLSLYVFSLIQVSVQVFSYFFMVTYFIENDRYHLKNKK